MNTDMNTVRERLFEIGFQSAIVDSCPVLVLPVGFSSDVQARLRYVSREVVFSTVCNGMLGDTVVATPGDAVAKAKIIIADVRKVTHKIQ